MIASRIFCEMGDGIIDQSQTNGASDSLALRR
jgi:hypothetical protein